MINYESWKRYCISPRLGYCPPPIGFLKQISKQKDKKTMREQINSQIKEAMKAKDSKRLMTLRLITAAIKDYDIAVRSDGNYDGATDQQVLQILAKMIKQRKESATQYANANRPEL